MGDSINFFLLTAEDVEESVGYPARVPYLLTSRSENVAAEGPFMGLSGVEL